MYPDITTSSQPRPILDRQGLLERIDGRPDRLAKLIELFASLVPSQLGELREALARQDGPRWRRAAHGLKGSVAALGGVIATEAVRHVEDCAPPVRAREASDALAILSRELDRLAHALEALCKEVRS